MIKAAIDLLFKRSRFTGSKETAREIDEVLRFHLELLTQENLQQDMSMEEAKAAALKRFGNVEQIKEQCFAIRRQGHPFLVALKSFLILMLLAGVVVRSLGPDVNIHQLGNLMIAVPILGRLLLYVRSLNPSSFLAKSETASPLRLNEGVLPLFTVYDQGMLTPVERLISDK